METQAKLHFSWVYTFLSCLAPCGTGQATIDTDWNPALLQNCTEHLADRSPFQNVT